MEKSRLAASEARSILHPDGNSRYSICARAAVATCRMAAMQAAETARQKSHRHAHITHAVHMARMAKEPVKYRSASNTWILYSQKAITVATTGDTSSRGSFFSLFHMACSSVTASR